MRVWLYPPLEAIDRLAPGAGRWERDTVRLAGAKLFADGTLNARTAWMLHPYADPLPGLPHGQAMVTPAQLDEAIATVRAHTLGLAVHAIGDAAVRAVLDAHQRAPSRGRFPHRIEHAELIDERDVDRFARLGIVCSVQPCHLLYDIEALRRGQPDRLDRVLPLKDLIAAGCRPGELLWFGSDSPIVRPDPQDSIDAAIHRTRVRAGPWGEFSEPIGIPQGINQAQAWQGFAAR
jgi:hypothetical protein